MTTAIQRGSFAVPTAAESPAVLQVSGRVFIVESAAGTDPDNVPLASFDTPERGAAVPLYTSSRFAADCSQPAFQRLWVYGQGDSEGTTLYYIVLSDQALTVDLPQTVEQPA